MRRLVPMLCVLSFCSSVAFAASHRAVAPVADEQERNAIANWQVPFDSYHPGRVANASGPLGSISSDALPSGQSPFIAVAPCRVVDTRQSAPPFTGPYGAPYLQPNTTRTIPIAAGPCPGIPADAIAFSLNITVLTPQANGFITVWPTGSTRPNVATLNYTLGVDLANAAIVPAGTSASIDVYTYAAIQLVVDINGYFQNGVAFAATGSANMSSGGLLTSNFFYPPQPGVTLAKSGVCHVTAVGSVFVNTANAGQGPYFRIAVKRGTANTDDGFFGAYLMPGAVTTGYAPSMSRGITVTMNAGEATQFGCAWLSPSTEWQDDSAAYCIVSWVCF